MYLYGASGHAKVIIDILERSGKEVLGLFDDNPAVRVLSGKRVFGKFSGQALDAPVIISIGNNQIRAKISQDLDVSFGVAIDPSAVVAPSARIGGGTVVMQGAIVQAEARIGAHAIINTAACVDHECVIGNLTHIAPAATLCGGVVVGEGSLIGAGAVVAPWVKVGKWCAIGAGAVVLKDIPDFAVAIGNPAKVVEKPSHE